jgi:hypothetical protein
MFIVAMFICGDFLSSPSKQWSGTVCHVRFGSLSYFFGLMYSKEIGLGNKAEVTFIAHCAMLLSEKFIHPV